MKQGLFKQLAEELEAAVREVLPRLAHIGGQGIPYRTALRLNHEDIITTAISAKQGDEVTLLMKEDKIVKAEVVAFDSMYELALLKASESENLPAWEGENPRLGMLALTVAFPSPEGPEARLELVRCVGHDYFQTDSLAFPGFSGAAVISPDGKLLGMVGVNAMGNRGQMIPYDYLFKLIKGLKIHGSRKLRMLGVHSRPVEHGLLVVEVEEGSAAQTAGLRAGDILVKVNEREVDGNLSLFKILNESEGEVDIGIARGDKNMTLKVTPSERLETVTRRWRHRGFWGY